MFITFSNWIRSQTKGWVLVLSTALFVLFLVFILPAQTKQMTMYTAHVGSPDLSFAYTPGDLYRMAESYGTLGRASYIHDRFTFDLIWPLIYTFFLAVTTTWLLLKLPGINPKWLILNQLPVFGMLADYTENITASIMMARYPQLSPGVDYLAPIFSLAKWLLIYSSFAVVILIFIIVVWRTVSPGKTT